VSEPVVAAFVPVLPLVVAALLLEAAPPAEAVLLPGAVLPFAAAPEVVLPLDVELLPPAPHAASAKVAAAVMAATPTQGRRRDAAPSRVLRSVVTSSRLSVACAPRVG
jgi:hypothetical protein